MPRNPAAGAKAAKPKSKAPAQRGKLTEVEHSATFVRENAGRFIFDHSRSSWGEWDGNRFAEATKGRAFRAHYDIYVRDRGERGPEGSRAFLNGSTGISATSPEIEVSPDELDADPWLFGAPGRYVALNDEAQWRSGVVRYPYPEARVTHLAGCEIADHDDPPQRWLSFLNEACGGDAEMVAFLQRKCGYFLTGSTKEQKLFFLHGDGGNGKSVFSNIIAHCLGSYGAVASMDMIASSRGERHPTSWAALKGRRWVIASETEKNRGWDESKIKVATGGDPITARFMRADEFTYLPQFKFHIVGNHEPKLRDVEEAMRRRFVLLPFKHKPSVVDRDLEEKLRAEGPAILRWMIEGCFIWQRHGLAVPGSIAAATSSFFERQDVLGQWLDECCQIGPDLQSSVGALFHSWSEYLKEQGEPAPTSRAFAQDMRKKGFQPAKSGAERRYRGLALADRTAEPSDYHPSEVMPGWDD